MTDAELAEFKQHMRNLRMSFNAPFWEMIYPSIEALTNTIEGFNDRLVALERKSPSGA